MCSFQFVMVTYTKQSDPFYLENFLNIFNNPDRHNHCQCLGESLQLVMLLFTKLCLVWCTGHSLLAVPAGITNLITEHAHHCLTNACNVD